MFGLDYSHGSQVVVTAGGTREKLDDVRYIGNFSGGKLGHALASAYLEARNTVSFLSANNVIERHGFPRYPSSAYFSDKRFTSAESLRKLLLQEQGARLILHAAAVSDYIPQRIGGKISSDNDELVIRLQRATKILPLLRDKFGPETTIVGFKLLSGVSEEDLIAAAVHQLQVARTDYCVANDLQEITPNERKVHLVQRDGDYQTITGSTQLVAQRIAQLLPIEEAAVV